MRLLSRSLVRVYLLAGIAALGLAGAAFALDPSKDMSQYVHDRWTVDRGFLGGSVFTICQSRDGYLWIGTERGLVRFDGFDFTLIQQPLAGLPAVGSVRGLITDGEGSMWVRLDGDHLLRYRNGKFENAMAKFGLYELAFTSMSLNQDGELLLWGTLNRLLRFHNGKFEHFAMDPDIPGVALSIAEADDRRLWMGTREIGLFQVDHGRTTGLSSQLAASSINKLLPVSGGFWIGTNSGLEFWDGHGLVKTGPSAAMGHPQILALTQDRDGNVWVGTERGLNRITPDLAVSGDASRDSTNGQPEARRDPDAERKPAAAVTAIFQDRDGDIWFGGPHGVERLRDGMFTGYSARQGLRSENNGPVYVDSEDRTWFAPPSGGLYWLKDRQIGHVTVAGLDQDVVYSITGGGGEIWVGRQHGGLTVLKKNGDSFAAHTYTESDGLAQNSVSSVHRSRDGTVWAGTVSAGISKLSSKSSNAAFTNYSVADGLASSAVFSIVEGDNGTMWFATPSGLSSFDGGKWKNYAAADGLPSSNIRSIFEDSKHVLWIATAEGLAFLASGRVNVPAYLTDSLREEILGITEDKLGSLWIVTSDHVLQVSRDRLLEGLLTDSDVLSYGTGNGLPGSGGVRRDRSVVADAHGRIWISLTGGLATADPAATARRAIPVSVRIESISAGGRPVPGDPSTPLKLASGTRSITVNYASSNLSIPQRIRFRYRLDKSDQGWSDDVALRQVVYTNLGPGSYQIRIVASNGMGLWNGPETVIQFSIAPAFWQTWWFRLLSVLALGLAGLGLYRLRFYQLSQEMNLRFQERLAERSRIAQELHDTLLQGVLSASLQLDVVEDQTPEDSPTKPLLKRILQLMGQVIDEGRIALRGLRAPDGNALDIETAFSRVRQEFATNEKATYRVLALGASRPLRPMIRDEVYRIGHEAVVNSFRHSRAANIEVEVEYADTHLRVLVRDDGIGIDPRILKDGREGHWGLTGMRERSERIGANLRLRSRIGAGTEVELTVSRAVAFGSETTGPVARWLPWFSLSWLHLPSPSRKKFNRTENGPGNENRPDQSKRD